MNENEIYLTDDQISEIINLVGNAWSRGFHYGKELTVARAQNNTGLVARIEFSLYLVF